MLVNLKELSITIKRNRQDEQYQPIAESFFEALPRLTSLDLAGNAPNPLLIRICNRHGSTLQHLSIQPHHDYYNMMPPYVRQAEDIEHIAQTCPKLTSLDIKIRRTKGDNRETRCYEALGKLANLKTAELYLDCANDVEGDMSIQNIPESAVERAVINSAMDETLAQSIWETMATPRLETLVVENGGGSGFGRSHRGDISTIVDHMSRHYRLAPVRGEVTIVELSQRKREKRDQFQREHELVILEKWGNRGLSGSAFDALEKLWALDPDRANWREVWKSFPLQRSP